MLAKTILGSKHIGLNLLCFPASRILATMSTVATANTAIATCLLKAKEEEKKTESVGDAQVNKNHALDDKKPRELSKGNVRDNVDHDAQVSVADCPSDSKSESDLSLEPRVSLKEQLGMDKDDASLKKRKEQLLGSVHVSTVEVASKEPEVKVLNLTVQSPGRPNHVVATPFRSSNAKATLFTLKEGCKQQIKFEFVVSKNTVSGLKYIGEVWKKGIKVDTTKKMVGTFSPREEPYKFELEEATTPSGFFARGSFAARTRFVDEDGKCYFDASYYFDIQKNWAS